MYELLVDPNTWGALLTLTALEIVLGVDNIVFISILVSRLEQSKQTLARQIGLGLALGFRILFLFTLSWIIGLKEPVIEWFGHGFSWRDIILITGGFFLLAKATHEIHNEIEGHEDIQQATNSSSMKTIIIQVVLIDIVFSVDSIITAIGMSDQLPIMITAVILSVLVMYVASGPISGFVSRHPTTKMLALAFLVMIGAALIADGFGSHVPRGYVYTSMAFAALVEVCNVLAKNRRERRKTKVNINPDIE